MLIVDCDSITTEDGRVRPKHVLIEFKKWMCYIDGQKNKYSALNECNKMLKYNILNSRHTLPNRTNKMAVERCVYPSLSLSPHIIPLKQKLSLSRTYHLLKSSPSKTIPFLLALQPFLLCPGPFSSLFGLLGRGIGPSQGSYLHRATQTE
jgi:hypothetical protein